MKKKTPCTNSMVCREHKFQVPSLQGSVLSYNGSLGQPKWIDFRKNSKWPFCNKLVWIGNDPAPLEFFLKFTHFAVRKLLYVYSSAITMSLLSTELLCNRQPVKVLGHKARVAVGDQLSWLSDQQCNSSSSRSPLISNFGA